MSLKRVLSAPSPAPWVNGQLIVQRVNHIESEICLEDFPSKVQSQIFCRNYDAVEFGHQRYIVDVKELMDDRSPEKPSAENYAEEGEPNPPSGTVTYYHDNSSDRKSPPSARTRISMSHRSSHHSSSSSKGKHVSSMPTSDKDDWSEIMDPEERRRVQNRIAQRKFRDKAKDNKERLERDRENKAHAGHSYDIPDPVEMDPDNELSGLPWGSLSLKHVVSKGKAKEEESRRGSQDRSRTNSREAPMKEQTAYYGDDSSHYDEGHSAS